MPNYLYRTYGIDVDSELKCPRLPPGLGTPQLQIRFGGVPASLKEPTVLGRGFQCSRDGFLQRVEGLGDFFASAGTEVRVDPQPKASEEDLEAYTFGSIFGMILHQRQVLALHASAIETRQGAVLFMGRSGDGKSTLAGQFYKRGYPVLCDDICAVSLKARSPRLHPSRASIRLREDALMKLGLSGQGLKTSAHHPGKRTLFASGSTSTGSIRIHAIYELHPCNEWKVAVRGLTGFQKIESLTRNIYRRQFLSGADVVGHFPVLRRIAGEAIVSAVSRPNHGFQLDDLADTLEAHFSERTNGQGNRESRHGNDKYSLGSDHRQAL